MRIARVDKIIWYEDGSYIVIAENNKMRLHGYNPDGITGERFIFRNGEIYLQDNVTKLFDGGRIMK